MHPAHPLHEVVQHPPGPRQMKYTLASRYMPALAPHLVNGIVPEISYKRIVNEIHSSTVKTVKSRLFNRILQGPPPPIASTEIRLPKLARRTSAQLRDDQCCHLQTYQKMIKKVMDDACPECGIAPHTTAHLFCCPAHPTSLNIYDLWLKPVEMSQFLVTLPSFSHLSALDLPLPRPPPEPPP
jgi:hypothetical protein